MSEPRVLLLFGVPIHDVTEDQVEAWMMERVRSRQRSHIVTSNLDFVRLASADPEMHRIHLEGDLVIADGMPLVWFSRLFGPALRERVAGSDLIVRFARAARDHQLSVYALGAAPGVAERAMKMLEERFPGLRVAGWESPPPALLMKMEDEATVRKIQEARPDILFVAMGSPKQEKWIRLHHPDLNVPVAIGIGASFDFLAGAQSRAPRWLQKIGMEWLWRLAGQPRRLFHRYFHDFLYLGTWLVRFFLLRCSPGGASRKVPPPDAPVVAAEEAALVRMVRGSMPKAAGARSVVLDLSAHLWLDSVALGSIVSLGRRCRDRGGRLFLAGRAPRVERLLRMLRMDRYLEIPETSEDLLRELRRLRDPQSRGQEHLRRSADRLHVILPREFTRDTVARVRQEFLRHWTTGEIRECVVDASQMSYIDIAGARFLRAAQRLVEREPGRSMWLLGFPDEPLRRMRREGLDSVRVDRRSRFRSMESAAAGR